MGQGARKVPRQFPLIFRISNRSHFSVAPCRTRASRSLALKAANGIVTLAKGAESESAQLRAWRAILADQIAVSKFSDLEYRLAVIEEQLGKRTGHTVPAR